MICPNCGAAIPDEKVLCPKCGEFLLSDSFHTTSDSSISTEPTVHRRVDPSTFQIQFDDTADLTSNAAEEFEPVKPQKSAARPHAQDLGPAPVPFPEEKEASSYSESNASPSRAKNKKETVVKKKTVQKKKRSPNRSEVPKQRRASRPQEVTEQTVVVKKKSGCGCGCITAVFLFFIGLFLIVFLVIQTLGMDTIKSYVQYFMGKDVSVSVDVNDNTSQLSGVESTEENTGIESEEAVSSQTDSDSDSENTDTDRWASVFEDLPDQ